MLASASSATAPATGQRVDDEGRRSAVMGIDVIGSQEWLISGFGVVGIGLNSRL
jgi:hypothetical protein